MTQMKAGLVLAASFLLGGCGLTTPAMENFSQKIPEGLEENTIINQVRCELHLGVQEALAHPVKDGYSLGWLRDDWGAKVTMNLTVDEKGALAPGLSFTSPFEKATQTFTANLGATASAQATRKETVELTYGFKKLLAEPDITPPCSNEDGVQIHSDLKIAEFIFNKATIAQIRDTTDSSDTKGHYPFTSFSDDVTFVVAVGASATPVFKLVRLSASSNSPLMNATRTKTQDILVTLSKLDDPNADAPKLTAEGQAAHNAELIGEQAGQAITSALRDSGITVP